MPDRLKALREAAGLSLRAVAEALRMSPSTYAHYEQRYKKPHIPVDLARDLARLFSREGIDPADVLALAGVPREGLAGMGLRESDVVEYAAAPQGGVNGTDPRAGDAFAALAGGRAHASLWRVRTPALEQAGFLPGDFVVFDLEEEPRPGDVVVAQIYDWGSGAARTVMRVYEPPYLVSASPDPRYRKPELVDDERVVVKGVAVAQFRRRG